MDSNYQYSKQILTYSEYNHNISSSLLLFPHQINIGNFQYAYSIKNYHMLSSISVINYGEFIDSESNDSFSASDYILKHTIYKQFNLNIHSSVDLKYIFSQIDHYASNALVTKFNFYYNYNRLLVESFISNYGAIFNSYTTFKEKLPSVHGISIRYSPKYIKSILSITYNVFDDYNTFNLQHELLFINQLSIILGYHSIASNLYSGNFDDDFLIGLSIGGSIKYKDYIIDLGVKNLGPIGVISSFTISKSIN